MESRKQRKKDQKQKGSMVFSTVQCLSMPPVLRFFAPFCSFLRCRSPTNEPSSPSVHFKGAHLALVQGLASRSEGLQRPRWPEPDRTSLGCSPASTCGSSLVHLGDLNRRKTRSNGFILSPFRGGVFGRGVLENVRRNHEKSQSVHLEVFTGVECGWKSSSAAFLDHCGT